MATSNLIKAHILICVSGFQTFSSPKKIKTARETGQNNVKGPFQLVEITMFREKNWGVHCASIFMMVFFAIHAYQLIHSFAVEILWRCRLRSPPTTMTVRSLGRFEGLECHKNTLFLIHKLHSNSLQLFWFTLYSHNMILARSPYQAKWF